MKFASFLPAVLAVGLATPLLAETYQLSPYHEKVVIERPISLITAPDDSKRQFLVQQRGKILILPKEEGTAEAKVFLDISDRKLEATDGQFEEGLLGLAFHPKFAENGKFYIFYSQQDIKRSVISEVQVSKADPDKADLSTERILMENPQPFWNHNSGNLAFGPDGFLYIGSGDGGKRDDVTRTAQNTFSLLGKILRIDVDKTQGSLPYGIPEENPFAKVKGSRGEIFAYGLRNPWGLSFDKDGHLWVADVGQDVWEEINIVEIGGNYGWSHREGARPFPLRKDTPPEDFKYIEPIHEYPHTDGISITGGFVYEGEKLPELKGAYIYGDWGSGRIWALKYDFAAKKVISNEQIVQSTIDPKGKGLVQPAAFSQGFDGDIYVLDWNGHLFRLGK